MFLIRPVRIIFFGVGHGDWQAALVPGADVWADLPTVKEVLFVNGRTLPKKRPLSIRRNVIIPLLENDIRHCPRAYPSLFPDGRSLEVLSDKKRFAAFVNRNELAEFCPRTYADIGQAVYPCILKRSDGYGGFGTAVVASSAHLRELLAQDMWRGRDFILQAYVRGEREYVTHCVCRDGEVLWHCSYEYEVDQADPIRRGSVLVKSIRPYQPPTKSIADIERFLRPLRINGPLNVDYKIDDHGRIVVMEINPRFGGSLMRPDNVGICATRWPVSLPTRDLRWNGHRCLSGDR